MLQYKLIGRMVREPHLAIYSFNWIKPIYKFEINCTYGANLYHKQLYGHLNIGFIDMKYFHYNSLIFTQS